MKRLLVLGAVLALLCSGCTMQFGSTASHVPAPEGFVKLVVTGTNVNVRPIPQTGGAATAQVGVGDVFIAEQWLIENTAEKTQWYRIVFAVKADGTIVPLSSADKRFKAGFFPFVSEKFATISPLTAEEDVAARKIPYRKGYKHNLGCSLPEIVRTFGPGDIKREFNLESIEYFGVGNLLLTTVKLPGLEGLLFEHLDGPYAIDNKHFTLTKPGFVYEGIAIATPGFGKEQVRALMKKNWKNLKLNPDISTQEKGERWFYSAEMWNCEFIFDEQGLVKSYQFYFTTG